MSARTAAGTDGHSRERSLTEVVEGREWYHTLELAPGVVTRGYFDHRSIAHLMLPRSCEGMRCLDIGTFDGFWALEMERRGAEEVIAIDILDERRWDWPAAVHPESRAGIERRKGAGDGFVVATRQLGSRVERLDLSVHELHPDTHGSFDLVFLGSLLHHLHDPVGALKRVRSVCRGWLTILDSVSLLLEAVPGALAHLDGIGRPCWWKPNRRALGRMVEAAGFELVSGPHLCIVPAGRGMPRVRFTPRTLVIRDGRELAVSRLIGGAHHARLLARPAPGT